MHTFDLKGRTAIITGGAQGFGFDIAKRFLQSGAKVIIWDIDSSELIKASKEVNDEKLSYNVVDVSNFEQVNKTVNEIIKKDNIDILINNAGITGPTATLWDYDVKEWNKIININLTGTFNCCKNIIPNMIKNNYGNS
jgi:2-dehydro-3-deoxy-L-rhamnonate dehydrogenase (NAD+)